MLTQPRLVTFRALPLAEHRRSTLPTQIPSSLNMSETLALCHVRRRLVLAFYRELTLLTYGIDTYWKYRHAAACLWPTIKLAEAEAASYEELMALDRKIRTFPVPTHLQATLQGSEVWSWSADSPQAVQQYCIVCDKELSKYSEALFFTSSGFSWFAALLFLHRNYLAIALRDENPLAHKFCGSVLAAYRCSTRICFALRDLYRLHPRTVGSMWYFWSSIFSACVGLLACATCRHVLTTSEPRSS